MQKSENLSAIFLKLKENFIFPEYEDVTHDFSRKSFTNFFFI